MQISQMNADCVEFFTQVSGAKPSDNENDSSSFSFFFWGYEHDLFAYPVLWRALRVKVAAKSPYSIRVPNDSKKDMEIVVAAFLSFLLLFSFFERPVHSVEIWADDDSQSGRLV